MATGTFFVSIAHRQAPMLKPDVVATQLRAYFSGVEVRELQRPTQRESDGRYVSHFNIVVDHRRLSTIPFIEVENQLGRFYNECKEVKQEANAA